MTSHNFLVVAAALVRSDGRVLMQQRPTGKQHGGLWEFPGGKLEADEAPEAALVRELMEELGIVVDRAALTPLGFASVPVSERHMVLLLYRVSQWQGDVRPIEAPRLLWGTPDELAALPMPPADVLLVEALRKAGD